jgi:hypothetical protein
VEAATCSREQTTAGIDMTFVSNADEQADLGTAVRFVPENEIDLVLGDANPNPEREGCPRPELLLRVAGHECGAGDPIGCRSLSPVESISCK